ncbi:hypothetical protein [Hyphobacterium sp.]|uniref:hypothetical protein n=1 Tax=Hyphobacterium sp. TaxID=2004662 RepID=UPI003BA9AA66
MMELFEMGTSAMSGGLLGMLGTALGRVTGYFEQRADDAQERQRWAHELQLEEMRNQSAMQMADSENDAARIQSQYENLRESLRNDASLESGYRWVSAVRALVRPVLTPLLWALYLIVFFTVMSGAADRFLAEQVEGDFIAYFISNIAFTASAATLWWFGDRARPMNQNR